MDKKILYAIIVGVVLLAIIPISFFIARATRPNNHDEIKYGNVTIGLVGWDSAQRALIQQSIAELNRLGPTFSIISDETTANVLVRNASLTPCGVHGAGTFTSPRLIQIDPTCTHGELQFRAAFVHEIGHYLGMRHICQRTQETSDCSSVGYGVAVMNPSLAYGEETIATYEIQALDVKEFRRIRP